MIKIVTIIGARPQFVKAAIISRLINGKFKNHFDEFVIHTGQHYDKNMSDVFFEEMEIPKPKINLNLGGGNHGAMTGQMLEKIETILLDIKPDYCLVYGDTNSTLAGALAASKLHIPVAHIEAGLRSYNKKMPEEQNRILTDHLSSSLFCPTKQAIDNLLKESITKKVVNVGDIMLDASLFYRKKAKKPSIELPEKYYLITLHRAENTDNKARLSSIINALNATKNIKGILPLHPRTKKILDEYGLTLDDNIITIDPVGYLEMLYLEKNCDYLVTDSGGVQKEAYFFKKPCITLREETEWIETVESGWNTLCGADTQKIVSAIKECHTPLSYPKLYGCGNTGELILKHLLDGQ